MTSIPFGRLMLDSKVFVGTFDFSTLAFRAGMSPLCSLETGEFEGEYFLLWCVWELVALSQV
jgi:hypothetical protein